MVPREWRHVRLRGAYWWEGTAFPADRQRENATADASKTDSEDQRTTLVAEGWTMVSVIGAAPVRLFQNRTGWLWQETFNVFLERQACEEG